MVSAEKSIGRYEVREKLGAGGMGEVYRAQDRELGRAVALKVLPPDFAANEQRVQRFKLEARAASALNHPHIVTIYEIGEADSGIYIATELVEGETLSARLQGGALPLAEALTVAEQIAAALAEAHSAGIVHRDIKPDNLMLRHDGYVKVLDFGLAKQFARPAAESEAETLHLVNTSPGIIMGTVKYMSPEQTRGKAVDARTDIWSLGVVLYEMATGQPPFAGETPSDTLASVLRSEPVPLEHYLPSAPDELQRIIGRALCKDRNERYQSVKDFALDLKHLRREIEHSALFEQATVRLHAEDWHRTDPPFPPSHTTDTPSAATRSNPQLNHLTTGALDDSTQYARNSSSPASDGPRRWLKPALIVCAVLLMLGGIYGLHKIIAGHAPTNAGSFAALDFSRLTNDGKASMATISPDGKYLAYATGNSGQVSLRMKQIATGSEMELAPPSDLEYLGLTFSPDGNYLYYVRSERKPDFYRNLYRVPTLGGAQQKLLADIDSPVSFAPDGGRLVFTRHVPKSGADLIVSARADGTGEETVASSADFGYFQLTNPTWSPDGQKIALTAIKEMVKVNPPQQLVSLNLANKKLSPVGAQNWKKLLQTDWTKDGSALLAVGMQDGGEVSQLWLIAYPDGALRRVTNDLNNYYAAHLDAQNTRIVTVQTELASNLSLWANDGGRSKGANLIHRLTTNSRKREGVAGVTQATDGRIVYAAPDGEGFHLWLADRDGQNARQLTTGKNLNIRPHFTPDGRYIVFTSDRSGENALWRMDADGKNPVRLTDARGGMDEVSDITPDGRWIIFHRAPKADTGMPSIMRVLLDGSAAAQPVMCGAEPCYGYAPKISFDGKRLAYLAHVLPDYAQKLHVVPFDGTNATGMGTEYDYTFGKYYSWGADNRSFLFTDNRGGADNIWRLNLSDGKTEKLTNFKSDSIIALDWSPDGKQMIFVQGIITSDVVLIKDAARG